MKTSALSTILITFLAAIGCQQPCTKTTEQATYAGDTIYTIRTYPNCTDTLSYTQKQVKADSSIVSEGKMLEGNKEGEWIYNGYTKRVITYSAGLETNVREYDKEGRLELERILGTDSLYAQQQFHENGAVMFKQLINLEGYLTGHGTVYDSTGRKLAEGDYIAEGVLQDTVYIESPLPPHDLQMTVIEESGGKHGPWLYYDFEGNIIDTVLFNRGMAVWTGDIVGKWELQNAASVQNGSSQEILMSIPNFVGYEFTADGRLGAFNSNGQTSNWGTYSQNPDGQSLHVFDNTRAAHEVFIFGLDELHLKFAIGNRIFYLKKVDVNG